MRASTSAACSGVGAVKPMPLHGARPLLLPDHVQRGERHLGVDPADVLHQRRLEVDGHGMLAERAAGPGEEQGADGGQALQRVERPVVDPVAVGPLVVTRRVDERVLDVGEVLGHRREARVGAGVLPLLMSPRWATSDTAGSSLMALTSSPSGPPAPRRRGRRR
jgi:hypothetical protein